MPLWVLGLLYVLIIAALVVWAWKVGKDRETGP